MDPARPFGLLFTRIDASGGVRLGRADGVLSALFCLRRCVVSFCTSLLVILSGCSNSIVIILCAVQQLHFKFRRGIVAGYTTDETLE